MRMHRGKAISFVCMSVSTNIARFGDTRAKSEFPVLEMCRKLYITVEFHEDCLHDICSVMCMYCFDPTHFLRHHKSAWNVTFFAVLDLGIIARYKYHYSVRNVGKLTCHTSRVQFTLGYSLYRR